MHARQAKGTCSVTKHCVYALERRNGDLIWISFVPRRCLHYNEVDMLILDFSKAFDIVPHQRLLLKMEHYGIRGRVLHWVRAWLTDRNQRVCLGRRYERHESSAVRGSAGYSAGAVMLPILYINDIGDTTSSVLRLFADDSLLYRTIMDPAACTQLQKDLTTLVEWSKRHFTQLNVIYSGSLGNGSHWYTTTTWWATNSRQSTTTRT